MSTTITQSAVAAFTDRPASGGVGLLVTLQSGNEGKYLRYDLSSAVDVLHCRFCLNAASVTGGDVVLLAGFDAGGQEIFQLAFDADSRVVTVTLADGQMLSATLNDSMAWHGIELKIAAVAGEAELWINGVSQASTTGTFSSWLTQTLWLGGIMKETATAGNLYLDEYTIADAYIGPVAVSPTSDYANDPARWLVVYNLDDNDSITWAESYRQARSIPYANLLGLSLPATETISDAEFADMEAGILSYLNAHAFGEQILGILLGHGVPGYVDVGGTGWLDALAARLHLPGTSTGGVSNPLGLNAAPTRPTQSNLGSLRLTARIDSVALADSQALVQRATNLMQQGLADGSNATVWLDPYTTPGPLVDEHIVSMVQWAGSLDRMRTRLPLELSAESDPQAEAQFDSIDHDGFFWGWRAADPPTGFFAAPAGDRVFCIQLELASATAATLRSAQPGNWVEHALDAGYTAAAGASRNFSASAVPYVRPFFEALRQGWSLAEAWFVACPILRDGLFLTGDPLLTIAMPRAGWDVFGPLTRLEQLDPTTPALALRESELSTSLSGALQPVEGQIACFLVRHIDDQGRSEANTRALCIGNNNGAATLPPLLPIWPDVDNWPVHIEAGQVVFQAVWDQPMRDARVNTLILEAQIDGGATQTLQTVNPDPYATMVRLDVALPTQSGRYRWRVEASDGAAVQTPWSTIVQPTAASTNPLQLIEV